MNDCALEQLTAKEFWEVIENLKGLTREEQNKIVQCAEIMVAKEIQERRMRVNG